MASASLPEENLEELFNEAANVVQANATGKNSDSTKPSDAQLLDLYGLYKVATTGNCNEPQPGIFNMKARSKWSAWKDKSNLSSAEAMKEYVHQVVKIYNWALPSGDDEGRLPKNTSSGFAPAVSRPHIPDEVIKDKDTPFGWVKDNEISKLKKWIAGKPNINICDDDGLSLLHWAADRGSTQLCEILLKAGANPDLKDEDDQTPLDYALTCEHEEIILLFKKYVRKPT